MNIALKEWAAVVRPLKTGRQILLLRKGGIVEAHRGGFELRHREFLLFPTFEHQHAASLQPEFSGWAEPPGADGIRITLLCQATDVFEAPAFEVMQRASGHFVWNERFLRMRYDYRPDLPLWVILVRAMRLAAPATIPDRPSYAGCKSWVHLTEEIDTTDAVPVLPDAEFAACRDAVLGSLQS